MNIEIDDEVDMNVFDEDDEEDELFPEAGGKTIGEDFAIFYLPPASGNISSSSSSSSNTFISTSSSISMFIIS